MKKIFLIMFLAGITLSCSDDLSDVNIDKKSPTAVGADVLFSYATKSLIDQMVNVSVNSNIFIMVAQHWTRTTYIEEANYDLVKRNINGSHWNILYADVLKNLSESKMVLDTKPNSSIPKAQIINQKAMLEILQVFTWHVLVDTFGDIPYSEALDLNNSTPVYDDAKTIYNDLGIRLDAAIAQIEVGAGGFTAGSDYIYNGNAMKWKKFGNSLKLRMALRYADLDDAKATKMAKEAIESGVFDSEEDSALMEYEASAPNTNPIWNDLVESGRADYVAANTLVDAMNLLDDPRRDDYFAQNQGVGVYIGGTYGGAGNTQGNSTIYNKHFEDPTLDGVILDYTEVKFLIAEAAARGFISENPETNYNDAIKSSILYWNGTEAEAADYISQPNVQYSQSLWKERIGEQKWIALYNRGFEAWSSWRKLNFPQLPNAAEENIPVPLRYTYPTTEATLNGSNWKAASSAIGGDTQQTPIFWDIN